MSLDSGRNEPDHSAAVGIHGFGLLDMLIGMGLGVVILGGALVLTSQAISLNDMVTQKSDMQQNGRMAVNLLARDLRTASTGFSPLGIQLPSGASSVDAKFACDTSTCYLTNNLFSNDRLYAVTPGNGRGPTIGGVSTDIVTLVYRDATSNLDQLPLANVNSTGTEITFDAATSPAYDNAVTGLKPGDVVVLSNSNGNAAATVTAVLADEVVQLAEDDPLKFNQPDAAIGNVKAILTPSAPTTAYRVHVITYYIDDSNADSPLLMRHVNAHAPIPVAEDMENFQITYDIFDETTGAATAALVDAGGTPNQIRKINVTLQARSPVETVQGREYQRVNLTTSVGPRNLTFRDRYE